MRRPGRAVIKCAARNRGLRGGSAVQSGHWSGAGAGAGAGAGLERGRSGCWYDGCPPPPLGPPGPTRMTGGCGSNGWSAGGGGGGASPGPTTGPPGSTGGGSSGAALTGVTPPVNAGMPMLAAIAAAAAAKRLTSISVLLPDIHHVDYQLPGRLGADASKQWQTATSSSCRCELLRLSSVAECTGRAECVQRSERPVTREAPARPQHRFPSPVHLYAAGGAGFHKPTAQARRCPCTARPEPATG
jgi:hypothetical protein